MELQELGKFYRERVVSLNTKPLKHWKKTDEFQEKSAKLKAFVDQHQDQIESILADLKPTSGAINECVDILHRKWKQEDWQKKLDQTDAETTEDAATAEVKKTQKMKEGANSKAAAAHLAAVIAESAKIAQEIEETIRNLDDRLTQSEIDVNHAAIKQLGAVLAEKRRDDDHKDKEDIVSPQRQENASSPQQQQPQREQHQQQEGGQPHPQQEHPQTPPHQPQHQPEPQQKGEGEQPHPQQGHPQTPPQQPQHQPEPQQKQPEEEPGIEAVQQHQGGKADQREPAPMRQEKELDEGELKREKAEKELLESTERKIKTQLEQKSPLGDPRSWKPVTLRVERGEFEHGVGCVVRAPEGCFSEADWECSVVDVLDHLPKLHPLDEVVSNAIRLRTISEAVLKNEKIVFPNLEPWNIALPHSASRNPTREAVMKCVLRPGPDEWREIATTEVLFDEHKEIGRFMEGRVPYFYDAIILVVSKLKTDRFELSKRGTRFYSSVDSRVNIILPPASVKVNIDATLQVQPLEGTFFTDLKAKHPNETSQVISTSHIFTFSCLKKKLFKELAFSFALPLNPLSKRSRPGTATAGTSSKKSEDRTRPKTANVSPSATEESDEEMHMVWQFGDGKWRKCTNLKLIAQKNKDIVTFETDIISSFKFMAFRTRRGCSEDTLLRAVSLIEKSLTIRAVHIVLRQNVQRPNSVIILATPSSRLERTLKSLAQEGYEDEDNSPLSRELVLQERQELKITFRGNIAVEEIKYQSQIRNVEDESDANQTMRLVFNTQLKNRIQFQVKEIDRFAQRAIESYRGFCQVSTRESVKKPIAKPEGAARKGAPQYEWVEEDKVLCELLMTLPKVPLDTNQPIQRIGFTFKSKDAVSNESLYHLACDLADEWVTLGLVLGLKRSRIQAIQRNNVGRPEEDVVYDMLLTWVKKVPTSANKVAILRRALFEVGREDLSEAYLDTGEVSQNEKHEENPAADKSTDTRSTGGKKPRRLSSKPLGVAVELGDDIDKDVEHE